MTGGALLTVENTLGSDAHAYWSAGKEGPTYDKAPGAADAFLYSPAFLLAISPLSILPWPAFFAIWVCIETAVLGWLIKPLPKRWSVPVFMCCIPELTVGNINILIAGAAVLALKMPAVWVFAVFTKVAPGVGMLWFAFRGDWRRFLHSVVSTIVVVIILLTFDYSTNFSGWITFLLQNDEGTQDGQFGFALRFVLAVILVAVGARIQKAWLIAPAMLFASPILFNFPALALLSCIPRLHEISKEEAAASGPKSVTASQCE